MLRFDDFLGIHISYKESVELSHISFCLFCEQLKYLIDFGNGKFCIGINII